MSLERLKVDAFIAGNNAVVRDVVNAQMRKGFRLQKLSFGQLIRNLKVNIFDCQVF